MKRKVISYKNLKAKMPLWATAMWITMMDYWKAPEWLWGVLGCLFFVLWVYWFVSLWTEESVDIFEDGLGISKAKQFSERLIEAARINKEKKR